VKKKKKVPTYQFSPVFFSPPLICVANKTKISADHIGRAYNSKWSIKMFCCFATGNVVLHLPGCTWAPLKQELGERDYYLQ
jgi:hypothetical protein